MTTTQLLAAVLTVVIGYLLKLVIVAINVPIDEPLYNAIVVGIVLWILKEIGLAFARARMPNMFK